MFFNWFIVFMLIIIIVMYICIQSILYTSKVNIKCFVVVSFTNTKELSSTTSIQSEVTFFSVVV